MPAQNLTTANVGIPIPLAYGFNRITGNQLGFITNPPSTSTPPYPPMAGSFPLMQVGFWAGGEGEWDGPDSVFIFNSRMLAYSSNGTYIPPDPTTGTIPPDGSSDYTSPLVGTLNFFHFHPGVDAALNGHPDNAKQGLDSLWGWFKGLVTSLRYTRTAYWGIGWTPQIGSSPGAMTPVLDMRCMRCRIYDASGNQIGYQFTTNTIWHVVDMYLRRIVKPEYHIDATLGPDPLTDAERNCFRWDLIAAAADAFDALGFSGSYAFTAGGNVSAAVEQMLLVCRGYRQFPAGQLALYVDGPRDPVFTVAGAMLLPNSFQADESLVHQNPNRYIANWLETNLPAVCEIATISRSGSTTTITTTGPNPCAEHDFIVVGGVEDDRFDSGYWVQSVDDSGVITAIGGSAPDSTSSAGGFIGYLEARFSKRAAEAPPHQQHQMAMGQVLPPSAGGSRLKRVKVTYDYANSTWQQAMLVLLYERYRDIGADVAPYQPPQKVQLTLWSESVDTPGNILWKRAICGNVITLDETVFHEFAGLWEIVEVEPHGLQVDPLLQGGGEIPQPSANAGTIILTLQQWNAARFSVTAPVATASFQVVPGSFLFSGAGGTSWAVTGGTVTLTSASGPPSGTYEITVTWSGITGTAPAGGLLDYDDGGVAVYSNQFPIQVVIYDPTSEGGNCVSVYPSGSTPPGGSSVILTVASPPALAASASYTV